MITTAITIGITSMVLAVDEPKYDFTPKRTEIRTVITTAYTSRVEETDDTPCISANGTSLCDSISVSRVQPMDRQFCAFNSVAFGTRIIVPGFGECEVVDRTSEKYSGRLDLYFGQDLKGALQWGKKTLTVKIIYDPIIPLR